MPKLIQICASQNDLFGLDADGVVYHYNFNTHSWMSLDRARDHAGSSDRADAEDVRRPRSAGDGDLNPETRAGDRGGSTTRRPGKK